jgi:hypothetical protein
VQAVIGHQADIIVGNQEQADLGTTEGIRAWRDMVIAQVQRDTRPLETAVDTILALAATR